jgi:FtsH-binding integral membrane protein
MKERGTDSQDRPGLTQDVLGCLGCLGVLLLLVVLVTAPTVASQQVSPWVGAALALLGMFVWLWLGPRPMPGLMGGLLCLMGLGALLGVLVACIVRGIKGLIA